MAVGKCPPPRTERLTTSSTTDVFFPFTEWDLAAGIDAITASILATAMQAAGGNTRARFAYQVALTRVDVPGPWALVPNGLTVIGNGPHPCGLR